VFLDATSRSAASALELDEEARHVTAAGPTIVWRLCSRYILPEMEAELAILWPTVPFRTQPI